MPRIECSSLSTRVGAAPRARGAVRAHGRGIAASAGCTPAPRALRRDGGAARRNRRGRQARTGAARCSACSTSSGAMATISTPSAVRAVGQHDGLGAEGFAREAQGLAAGGGDELAGGRPHVRDDVQTLPPMVAVILMCAGVRDLGVREHLELRQAAPQEARQQHAQRVLDDQHRRQADLLLARDRGLRLPQQAVGQARLDAAAVGRGPAAARRRACRRGRSPAARRRPGTAAARSRGRAPGASARSARSASLTVGACSASTRGWCACRGCARLPRAGSAAPSAACSAPPSWAPRPRSASARSWRPGRAAAALPGGPSSSAACGLDQVGQVGGHHGAGIDHRVAGDLRLLALAPSIQTAGRPKAGSVRRRAGQRARAPGPG